MKYILLPDPAVGLDQVHSLTAGDIPDRAGDLHRGLENGRGLIII